ncbi:MAG: isopeptide-forming domain-containing fimbrial protein, partial [Clostridia bacterium]
QNSALITLNKTPAFSFASNTVTAAFGAAPTRIPVTKAPIVQTVPSSVGAPVVFTLGFTLPQDTFGYGSITITDSLAPELLYDSAHSTISFGAEAATPLKASVAGNSVTVELMSLDAHAGEAVLITLAATVAAIPASGKLLNIAELMVNHDLSLLSTSNEVTVSFGRLPQVSPAKTASASTYKPDTDAEIDFTITYPSANIGNNTTIFSISDIIDSNLQVVSYNLSISPSSELFISDQSIENTVQYEINTAYPQGSTSVFPDSFTLKIKAKYQAHTITDPAYVIENTAFVDFGSGMLSSNVVRIAPTSESQHAINDLIESVALEQTALSHILNAEGEKIQAALAMPSISVDMTLRVNASVRSMIDSVSRLEMVLSGKLHLFKNIIEK